MDRRDEHPDEAQELLMGLAPIVSESTVLLILGSFPSARSIAQRQYYAHPQNQFWRILQATWPDSPLPMGPDSYRKRSDWLLARGLGVWDVYASCRARGQPRFGASATPSSTTSRACGCRRWRAIAHNGGESFRHARHTRTLGVPVHRLPSSSPAMRPGASNARLAAWREVIAQHAGRSMKRAAARGQLLRLRATSATCTWAPSGSRARCSWTRRSRSSSSTCSA